MQGYTCLLPIDELNKLREEFWNSKLQEKHIWRYLRQATLMDDGIVIIILVRCANLIKQLNLTPIRGCLNCLQDKEGKYYYIPNFCINDPFLERNLDSIQIEGEFKTLKVMLCF
jgi:hypothetical protein